MPPPNKDELHHILYKEIETTVKRLKKHKSPGIDGITGEMIQVGGEKVTDMEREHTRGMEKIGHRHITEERRPVSMQQLQNNCSPKPCKVLKMVLLERLKAQMEMHLSEEQAGIRRDRSTVQQILIMRQIAGKAKRKGRHIINCFIDFQKVFDLIKHNLGKFKGIWSWHEAH